VFRSQHCRTRIGVDGNWMQRAAAGFQASHRHEMIKAWKIISEMRRPESNYSHKEYFLVAASERALALARLRLQRPDLIKSRFTVSGEADPEYTAWLSMRDGDVLSVMGGSENMTENLRPLRPRLDAIEDERRDFDAGQSASALDFFFQFQFDIGS
jgi:hypothetical protein